MTRRRSLAADRRGGIAILAAAGMTALIAMAAFAIDLGAAYAQRARLQKVADSAALAGEISWVKSGGSATAAQATVQDVVAANGWATSIIKTTTAPTSAVPNVTVSLAAPSTLTLARVLASYTTVTTTGYSVASLVTATTAGCLLALNQLMVNGTISTGTCAVMADSTASNAITDNSGGSITASSVITPGAISGSGTVNGVRKTGATAVADPYTGFQTAVTAAENKLCASPINYANQTSLNPGCYTNANFAGSITLAAGTYVFQGGNQNSGSISGTGVTLIFENTIPLGGTLSITAPTTGAASGIPGLAVYAGGDLTFNTNATYTINGALYSPTGRVTFNTGTFNASGCTYIVAQNVTSNSGSNFTLPQTNCSSYPGYAGYNAPGGSKIGLIQ